MESVRERQTIELTNAEMEAQRHNAMIKERYRLLKDAEEVQFANSQRVSTVQPTVSVVEETVYASPTVEDAPVVEQIPQVTEFLHEKLGGIFTAEKFEALQEKVATIAPTYVAPVVQRETAVVKEERYGLTPLAKVLMAVATFVILAMLALIGVNSAILRQKTVRLENIEAETQQLQEEYAQIMSRVREVTSEESILAWAEENGVLGMIS